MISMLNSLSLVSTFLQWHSFEQMVCLVPLSDTLVCGLRPQRPGISKLFLQKCQLVTISDCTGHTVSAATTQQPCCSMKSAGSSVQMSEHAASVPVGLYSPNQKVDQIWPAKLSFANPWH